MDGDAQLRGRCLVVVAVDEHAEHSQLVRREMVLGALGGLELCETARRRGERPRGTSALRRWSKSPTRSRFGLIPHTMSPMDSTSSREVVAMRSRVLAISWRVSVSPRANSLRMATCERLAPMSSCRRADRPRSWCGRARSPGVGRRGTGRAVPRARRPSRPRRRRTTSAARPAAECGSRRSREWQRSRLTRSRRDQEPIRARRQRCVVDAPEWGWRAPIRVCALEPILVAQALTRREGLDGARSQSRPGRSR